MLNISIFIKKCNRWLSLSRSENEFLSQHLTSINVSCGNQQEQKQNCHKPPHRWSNLHSVKSNIWPFDGSTHCFTAQQLCTSFSPRTTLERLCRLWITAETRTWAAPPSAPPLSAERGRRGRCDDTDAQRMLWVFTPSKREMGIYSC